MKTLYCLLFHTVIFEAYVLKTKNNDTNNKKIHEVTKVK